MEWWKWLIAILSGGIEFIVTAIISSIVHAKPPDLGGTFSGIGTDLVEWPDQKYVDLTNIETPGHVVFFVDIDF